MKRYFSQRKLNILLSAAAIAAMWLVWIIAYRVVANDYIIPSFTDSLKSFWYDCILAASFWKAFFGSLLRTVIAFLISFFVAAALTALCTAFKPARSAISPFMAFFRTLPTLAVILMLLIWTNPKVAPVIVTVLVLFPMMYARFLNAADGIDGGVRQALKVYGVSKKTAVFRVYLPMISPYVLPQTGADISLGLKIMISAEVLANTFGSLGGMMQQAKLYLEMPLLAALTLAAVFAGLIIDAALSNLSKINAKWFLKEGTV